MVCASGPRSSSLADHDARRQTACLLTSPFTCSRSTREGIERDYTPTRAAPDIQRLPGDEVLAGAWQWLSVSACKSNFPGFHKGGAEWCVLRAGLWIADSRTRPETFVLPGG